MLKLFGTKKLAIICVNEKIRSVQKVCDLKDGMTSPELKYISELLEVIDIIRK